MVVNCPCGRLDAAGRALSHAQCCGPYLQDFSDLPAPDAETLMRSRYSAFVLERADYLLATWHASTRPSQVSFDSGVMWLGLELRARQLKDASHAEVEFVARQRDKSGRAVRLHERSRFVREPESGVLRWYYLNGEYK